MLDMWLVEGVDPLFQIVFYLFGILITRWFAEQAILKPVVVAEEHSQCSSALSISSVETMEQSEQAVNQGHCSSSEQAVPIPVWDDEPQEEQKKEAEQEQSGSAVGSLNKDVKVKEYSERLTYQTAQLEQSPIPLSDLKVYKLRQQDVVRVTDLDISVPSKIRRYILRKIPVVKVSDLQAAQLVTV